jgi:pyruvate,water dikinase
MQLSLSADAVAPVGLEAGRDRPTLLQGSALSPGVATGAVRFVRTADDAVEAPPGSVVVADHLPASWVPLLRAPAAVVTARGGVLSNTAIQLREAGVPASAVLQGLETLRPGDRVEVDGATGRVRRR